MRESRLLDGRFSVWFCASSSGDRGKVRAEDAASERARTINRHRRRCVTDSKPLVLHNLSARARTSQVRSQGGAPARRCRRCRTHPGPCMLRRPAGNPPRHTGCHLSRTGVRRLGLSPAYFSPCPQSPSFGSNLCRPPREALSRGEWP